MAYFSEYLQKGIANNFDLLTLERKKQLKEIKNLRGGNRDIFVYASDLNKNAPTSICYDDILYFCDQLPVSKNKAIDIILETPGGIAEVVEDLVRIIRTKYDDVAIIVPGYAKSAGTIFAMSADEILMGISSALGPIDAQIINPNGKIFSAGAFLNGLEKIKEETRRDKKLELAYIPILQNISPGEIETCENGQQFSQKLVFEWLHKYKFKNWTKHFKSGKEVTDEEKINTAKEIASKLCDNSQWKTHGKSLSIEDLEKIGLKITNYSLNKKLEEKILRYYTLLRMSFEISSIYKIFENENTQVYKMIPIANNINTPDFESIENVVLDVNCPKCNEIHSIVASFGNILEENKDKIVFPSNNVIFCRKCHNKINLAKFRIDIERQFNKKIVENS